MTNFFHKSVLLQEAIESLAIDPDGTYIDATFGRGGYTKELLKKIDTGHIISIDQDLTAINYGKKTFVKEISNGKLTLIHCNFQDLKEVLCKENITNVSGIVFDLGVSSPQFDDASRGFSYRFNGPLDMRMDQSSKITASDIINNYSVKDLRRIFNFYGNTPATNRVVDVIVSKRSNSPIDTTEKLVEAIELGLPAAVKRKKGHPAKKFFQALRIEVNNELSSLESGLKQSLEIIDIGGIVSVVTFQPLEDKIVSRIFRKLANYAPYPKNIPIIPEEVKPKVKFLKKQVVLPSNEEILINHRSHSAKLRSVKKLREILF